MKNKKRIKKLARRDFYKVLDSTKNIDTALDDAFETLYRGGLNIIEPDDWVFLPAYKRSPKELGHVLYIEGDYVIATYGSYADTTKVLLKDCALYRKGNGKPQPIPW